MKYDFRATAVSRRQVMTLGMAGLAGLLLPRRDVLADSPTLEDQFRSELEITVEHFRSEGGPQTARSRLEDKFISDIRTPVLAELPQLGASLAEINSISLSLDQVQDKVGEVTEDWANRIVNIGTVLEAFNLDLATQSRLDQPTFQPPFTPQITLDLGFPTPATSQTPADMLGNLRAGQFPIDPEQISAFWELVKVEANSDFFARQLLTARVEANNFLDFNLRLKSPAGTANLHFDWGHYQNGSFNEFTGDFLGEFNGENLNVTWLGFTVTILHP